MPKRNPTRVFPMRNPYATKCHLSSGNPLENGASLQPYSPSESSSRRDTRGFPAHRKAFSCTSLLVYSAMLSQELFLKGDVEGNETSTGLFTHLCHASGAVTDSLV
jgi:hypothetical protein